MDHDPAIRNQTVQRILLTRIRARDAALVYGGMLRNWRPPPAAYLVPLTFGVLGLGIALAVPGETNPLVGVGIAMFSISIPAAGLIALNRLLNNVDQPALMRRRRSSTLKAPRRAASRTLTGLHVRLRLELAVQRG